MSMKGMWIGSLLVLVAATAHAQNNETKKIDFSFYGGLALTRADATTDYADRWSFEHIADTTEHTVIHGQSKKAVTFGAAVTYPLTPRIGIQASLGYLKADVPNTSAFDQSWTWDSTGEESGTFTDHAVWSGTGSLTVIPISFDAVGTFKVSRFEGFVSAGPTVFRNSFESRASIGYGVSLFEGDSQNWDQWIDALQIPATIAKTSWTSVGGNVGAGLVYKLTDGLGVFAEGRAFFAPSKELTWQLTQGTYDGLAGEITGRGFDQSDLEIVVRGGNGLKYRVSPAFFQIVGGVKVYLK